MHNTIILRFSYSENLKYYKSWYDMCIKFSLYNIYGSRIVEVRKNILITRELDDDDTFVETINIGFIPDEVIIKSIIFRIR